MCCTVWKLPPCLLAFHIVAMEGELVVLLSSEDCILKSIANAAQRNNCLPYGESTLTGDTIFQSHSQTQYGW